MRQVGEKELQFVMMLAVRKLSASTIKGLASNVTETRARSERSAAADLVACLKRYEIMIDAPPYPGDDGQIVPNGKAGTVHP